jgi:hypothetical protein
MMITQVIEPDRFHQKARRIRTRLPVILSQWGLPSRFKRWRLTQDPQTGLVVLFAVLNNKYIASHTTTPFSNYFDPNLLHDLANDLHVQVVSCHSDGLRYAFILDRGQVDELPTHIEFPFLDGEKLFVRVVYADKPVPIPTSHPTMPTPPINVENVKDQTLLSQGVVSFLRVLDDINRKDEAAFRHTSPGLPDLIVIDNEEFKRKVTKHDPDWERINHIRRLLGSNIEISQKMQEAMLYALVNNGKLCRYRGGFWAMENWRNGQYPWFGTSTIKALVSHGLMTYTIVHQEKRKYGIPTTFATK